MSSSLFDPADLPPEQPKLEPQPVRGTPRLRVPVRNQIEMHMVSLDDLVDAEHQVRAVWAFVESLDLSAWVDEVRAVEGNVGRDSTDPRLLMAVWMYATLEGEGSSRRLEVLCQERGPYKWLCGGVSLSYHTLSTFRSEGGEKWKQALTGYVAVLLEQGLVSLKRIAEDGMRVRANAGSGSFRTRTRLEECLEEAAQRVALMDQIADQELSARVKAARERAAKERYERVQQAIRNCEQLQHQREQTASKSGRDPKPPRASTTDPESRSMKMANGGYNPAYNVLFATDTATGIIADVLVTNIGNDSGLLMPMLELLEEDYGIRPDEALVDGGFVNLEDIEKAFQRGTQTFAPIKNEQKQLDEGKDPYAKKKGDTPGVVAWRSRMQTPEAKEIYKLRSQTAEWVNAQCRNHDLHQMPVRGLTKCNAIGILHALVHNFTVGPKLAAKENPKHP